MPRSLQPLHKMQNCQLQRPTSRHTSRYLVVVLKIVLQRPHPTGAVAPTCRREYGLVNGILAGYESDDSWDNASNAHEHTHTHNIVPLLVLGTWNNHPHRGREQQQPRQNNNINMRTGHAPYSRPWDNQPYGRRTHSQQALHARAYRKIQCRYPIQ